jgi:putative DNA-invertase from lambdoid prophage Rac
MKLSIETRHVQLDLAGGVGGLPLQMGAKMVDALRAGDILIASKLDRVFRNLIDALTQIESFSAREITCILLDIGAEPLNSTGAGKLQFQMLSALAEFERNRISDRIRDSFDARRANNIAIFGRPPFGFAFEGKGDNKRLVPDPGEQEILEAMRRLYSEGHSYNEITRRLNEVGYRSRRGTTIKHGAVRRLLIKQNLAPRYLDKNTVRLRQRRGMDEALRDWTTVKSWLDPLKPTQMKQQQRRAEADRALLRVINRIRATGITTYRGIADKLTAANTLPSPSIVKPNGALLLRGMPLARRASRLSACRFAHAVALEFAHCREQLKLQLAGASVADWDKHLVANPHEQEILTEMRRLHKEGGSFSGIAREVAARGYRNRNGNIIDSAHTRLLLLRDQPETHGSRSRSESIKAAIARKREHGWIPGNPHLDESRQRGTAALMQLRVERYQRLEPIIHNYVREGYTSYRTIAIMLNAAKVPTLRSAKEWYPASVRKVMQRLGLYSPFLPGRPRKPCDRAAQAPETGPPSPTPLNTTLRRWHKKRNVRILALRDDGLSAAEIAARLPLGDANAVRRILREAGSPLGLKRTAAKADDILGLRQAGRPVREIAEKTGLHVRSIYRFLAQEGEGTTEDRGPAFAEHVLPIIWNLQAGGVRRQALAEELNRRQIAGPNGQPWTSSTVTKLISQHREPSAGLQEHKTAAVAAAVLPLILQLQRKGDDTSTIASKLKGKFTGRAWSTAAVEAVLERAAEALAMLPAPLDTEPAPGDTNGPSRTTLNGYQPVVASSCAYDEAWLAEHVWPAITNLRAAGYKTAGAISHELNARGIPTPSGIPWATKEVNRLMHRTRSPGHGIRG